MEGSIKLGREGGRGESMYREEDGVEGEKRRRKMREGGKGIERGRRGGGESKKRELGGGRKLS